MRVLLVDDDTLPLTALTRRLRARGLRVDPAGGVREALDLLAGTPYAIVISDENLEDGYGHALLATAATRQPNCRRALMSAAQMPSDAAVVWDRFFAKPDDIEELVSWSVTESKPGDA